MNYQDRINQHAGQESTTSHLGPQPQKLAVSSQKQWPACDMLHEVVMCNYIHAQFFHRGGNLSGFMYSINVHRFSILAMSIPQFYSNVYIIKPVSTQQDFFTLNVTQIAYAVCYNKDTAILICLTCNATNAATTHGVSRLRNLILPYIYIWESWEWWSNQISNHIVCKCTLAMIGSFPNSSIHRLWTRGSALMQLLGNIVQIMSVKMLSVWIAMGIGVTKRSTKQCCLLLGYHVKHSKPQEWKVV